MDQADPETPELGLVRHPSAQRKLDIRVPGKGSRVRRGSECYSSWRRGAPAEDGASSGGSSPGVLPGSGVHPGGPVRGPGVQSGVRGPVQVRGHQWRDQALKKEAVTDC